MNVLCGCCWPSPVGVADGVRQLANYARAVREREMAVRQAVGASRARIVRQLLVETLLLAVLGTHSSALAQALSRFLVASIGTTRDNVFLDVTPDWRVLGFATAVALLTCIFFGLTPAFRATRVSPGAAMKVAGRGLTAGRERFSLRRALVVVQVALSLVLVASALLFSRSLNKLMTVDAGFDQEGLLITRIGFNRLRIPDDRRVSFRNELLERIKAVPGVQSATDMDAVPLTGGGRHNSVWLSGKNADDKINASFNPGQVDYFKTLKIQFIGGRGFATSALLPRQKLRSLTRPLRECCASRTQWSPGSSGSRQTNQGAL